MSRTNKTKKHMSNGIRWIITFLLVIVAISMVIVCVKKGVFHFEAGTVKANDEEAMETVAPDVGENSDDSGDSSKYTVFVTAGNGGTANPAGSVTVEAWDSITVSFTPDDGYEVESVTLDGKPLGAVTSYTVSYIDSNHTIVATFTEEAEEPEELEETESPNENGGSSNNGGSGDSFNNMITDGINDIFGMIFR